MSLPRPQLLANKVCAVTGGTTGIGRAIALAFLRHGARGVVVNHRDSPAQADRLASLHADADAGGRLLGVHGDIAQPAAGRDLVAQAVARFGGLDVFVSNAGVCRFADFFDIDEALLADTLGTNLSGAFHATQAAARQMVLQGRGGSIIGVSSVSALVGGGRQAHYTPTKAGVLSLMQSCAVALGPHRIRCNALLPGTVRTALNDEDLADDARRAAMETRVPLGRLGVPDDLAGPAVFLASDMSAYVTGAQLLVDGGLFVNLQ